MFVPGWFGIAHVQQEGMLVEEGAEILLVTGGGVREEGGDVHVSLSGWGGHQQGEFCYRMCQPGVGKGGITKLITPPFFVILYL